MLAEDVTWIKIGIMINVDVSAKIWENIRYVKKKIIWNLGTCTCKKEVLLVFSRYLWWIYKGDKSCSKNFFNKNYSNKNYSNRNYFSKFYGRIFAWFSLITKSLLKIVSIYYCFMKHWAKEKHFFPYCNSSKKLNEIDINNII